MRRVRYLVVLLSIGIIALLPALILGCAAQKPAGDASAGSPVKQEYLVAYAEGGRIGVMTPDGQKSALLSPGPGDYTPVWSPDGTKIAFVRLFPADQKGTYVMAADGSGVKKIMDTASYYIPPVWSPDSQRLAVNDHAESRRGLWTVKADGTDAKQLFKDSSPIGSVAWSPDGATIAFTFNKQPTTGGLYLIDATGGEPRLVLDVNKDGLYRAGALSWSPDGTHIAVRSNPKPAQEGQPPVSPMLSLVQVGKDGTAKVEHRITNLVEGPWYPAWHPSSNTVSVLAQGNNGKQQLGAVSVDTGKLEVLGEQAHMRSPVWSSDGGMLMAPTYDTASKPMGMIARVTLKDPDGMGWAMSMDMTDMMKPDHVDMAGDATQIAICPTAFSGTMPAVRPASDVKVEGLRWADITWKGFT